MSEDKGKKCSKRRTVKPLENFDGKGLCQTCSDYKQRYREHHREELRQKAKEHYEQYKQQKLCKIDISRCKMLRHERTQRHKTNLNKDNNKQIEQPVLSDKKRT